jgi:hypothetical protein
MEYIGDLFNTTDKSLVHENYKQNQIKMLVELFIRYLGSYSPSNGNRHSTQY